MKKRVLSIAVILVMLVTMLTALTACGDNAGTSGGDESNEGEDGLTIAIVVRGFGDNGPLDNLAEGALRAERDFGVTLVKVESDTPARFEEDIRAVSADADLVVTTFPNMTDATVRVAEEFPDTRYAAIFQFVNDENNTVANLWDTEFHGQQAFYIAGYMAAQLSENNRIGLIIGGEEPTPNAEGNAFMQGVRDSNPDVEVEFAFVGSYEDPATAKEIASAMIARGADFLQTSAGASNAGVIEAAQEAGVLVAGEITDFYEQYDGFVGVIGIGFGDTIYQAIEMLVNGEFPGGTRGIRTLANGGYFMDWATYERFADANETFGATFREVIERAREIERQILDEEKVIPFDPEVPNWDRISAQ